MSTLNFAIIGCGAITLQNHLPGIAMCPETKVQALCDSDPAALERAEQATGVAVSSIGQGAPERATSAGGRDPEVAHRAKLPERQSSPPPPRIRVP